MSNTTATADGEFKTEAPRGAGSFYRPELDAIRFVAFLLVFCHHTIPRSPSGFAVSSKLGTIFAAMANASGMGLCLFFALSAYLICELLLREKVRTGTINMRRFYIRRMLRIWPLYFLGIALGVLWDLHFGGFRKDLPWFTAYSLMVGNIYISLRGWGGIASGPAGPLWSISVEEQFYVLFPGLAKYCSERRLQVVAWTTIATANATLVYFGLRHADLDATVWTNSLVQFYMFGAGILLSLYLKGRMPSLPSTVRVLLFGCGLAAWFIAAFAFHIKTRGALATVGSLVPGYALVASGCVAMMLAFMGIREMPRWISYLGRLSYGLYVFHFLAIDEWGGLSQKLHIVPTVLNTFAAGFAGCLVLAMLSYKYFEAPFRRWKDKEAIIHTQPPESLSA
jgi:peptidoglycan/LPS O-acetylase OafA/YrhL